MATKKVFDRKTQPTDVEVDAYLASVENELRRSDAEAVTQIMRETTKSEAVMWGPSMIGFGKMSYVGADNMEREWFAIGLSPRKAALTLYIIPFDGSHQDLIGKLGKVTVSKGCVYVKKLSDVDGNVLRELIKKVWDSSNGAVVKSERAK